MLVKAGKHFVRALLIIAIGLIIGTSVYSMNARALLGDPMPMPLGYGTSVVLSGSMEPTLSVNDFVFIQKADTYKINDIVVYQSGEKLIIHRIIAETDDGFITKGDANNVSDPAIESEQIKGKLVFSIPHMGSVIHVLQSSVGRILLVVLACYFLFSDPQGRRKEREMKEIQEEIAAIKSELNERT